MRSLIHGSGHPATTRGHTPGSPYLYDLIAEVSFFGRRRASLQALAAAAAGVHTDQRGYITINERLETNVPGIYALGDVKGGPAFTHISYDDWRIIRTNLLDGGHATTTGRPVPYTVFIDPSSVGWA